MFMKAKHLIIAGMALLAFAACNKEGSIDPIFKGDKAYINVQLAYSSPETKGTATTPPFYYGTAKENEINNAHFFFYYADGSFAAHASKTLDWKSNGLDDKTQDNIERIGGGVVVLEGLKSTVYPAYMSVVLNASDKMVDDLSQKSIVEAQAYIVESLATQNDKVWTNFTMSSTTFDNGEERTGYFCEKVQPQNFQETADDAKADANVVTAYVERLAAKVQVSYGENLNLNNKEIGSFDVDGTPTTLYFNILGWGLNGTAKTSYTFKNIKPTWTAETSSLGFTWNDASNHRSYWAKFPLYDDSNAYYPLSNEDLADKKKETALDYISYNGLNVEVGKSAYCRENTNTKKILKEVFASAVTSVLLKAQVVDKEGKVVGLVNFDKKLYTFDKYKKKVLDNYFSNADTDKKIYKKTADNKYEGVNTSDLVEENIADGNVKLKFINGTYYTGDGTDAGTYTKITADAATALLNGNDAIPATLASYYKDGQMYYDIPIEHLREGAKYTSANFKTNGLEEGLYGVVRNHYYMLSINSIKNLGKAVYDPEEVIIPSDDDIKNYYVGAKINILSWKVVEQGVDL